MKVKKVAVVSSTRADYNYFRLILKNIIKSESLELSLLVTGMHLLKDHGYTIEVIKKDKIPIAATIEMYDDNDFSDIALGKAIGKAIIKFTKELKRINPDLLLILGDRYEPLAAVIAASTLLIPIAHIHGGDNVTKGQIDEQIRHSITKFAHLHFPATERSAGIIKLLGEEDWRIYQVGSPSIDHINQLSLIEKDKIFKKLALDPNKKLIICLQHPFSLEPEKSGKQMEFTLAALKDLNLQSVVIYPNNDPGSNSIINEIKNYNNNPNFKIVKNLHYLDYYSLLKNADLLIGNSSGGIIESPVFKLPVVNIGDRNKGRESAENVINVPHIYDEIKKAIERGLSTEFKNSCKKLKNPYGDGTSSMKIVKILEDIEIDRTFLIKKLSYDM